MATVRVPHMMGGTGETSYANNSSFQRKVIMKVKPILEESVKRMITNTGFQSCWKVVDLGCSSGPNALLAVSNILNSIIDKYNLSLKHEIPVFQIYLNDLYGNDFNTIMKLLPDFNQSCQERGAEACFVRATPGNFYGRLFPNDYIHFFHSSCSIHWLSQAPKNATNIAEPLNKGDIYLSNTSPPSVYEAYSKQFAKDFKVFLKSRSKELSPGGIMVLTLMGREKLKEYEICYPGVVFGKVLNDMVQEGLVEEKKVDFFDIPIYNPTAEEIKQVIEVEGSFILETLKSIKIDWDGNIQEDVDDFVLDYKIRGDFVSKYMRAGFEPLISAEFGKDIMDELFSRFTKKVAQLIKLDTMEYTFWIVTLSKYP
ncbi:hypothetical protein VNO77_07939 [Canavalia gladiata]|uniref:Uncharacterized protein n=1 Tax=Canavalia gladiata TaxID=3824 RepID=A0AAN9M9J9_CANGL